MSLISATVLVAAVSALAALLVGRIGLAAARWLTAALVPLVAASIVYWMPVVRGASVSEYSAWALLGIGFPFLAGLPVSVVATFLIARYAKGQSEQVASNEPPFPVSSSGTVGHRTLDSLPPPASGVGR